MKRCTDPNLTLENEKTMPGPNPVRLDFVKVWLEKENFFKYMSVMEIIHITSANAHIFEVFVQDYEAEFSAITKKEPNAEGRFALEADWHSPNKGFYQFVKGKPVGFVIRSQTDEGSSDIAEFYILPCYRKKGLGKLLAFAIFDLFPGPWQVRQIPTALDAIAFWRATIDEYTNGKWTEDKISDAHWGSVVRQCFESRT